MKRFILLSILAAVPAWAGQKLEYKTGGTAFEGYLALPETKQAKHAAALIVHDWMGPSEFTEKKADEMARLGYVALAADMYGKGVRPQTPKDAGAQAGKVKGDQKLMRDRIRAALDALKKQPGVDPRRIVVFGYCFGGTTALELARSGAEVAAVASFHGGLATRNTADAKNIKAKLLVMHGALDPHVPVPEVEEFQKEMNAAGVDYQFIAYSGAVHAFAVPGAGNDPKSGAAYNAAADRRSWQAFLDFIEEAAPAIRTP